MNSKILVVHKEHLKKLVDIDGVTSDAIYVKLLYRLKECKQIIDSLENKIPTNYRPYPTRNNLQKGYLEIKNLVSIFCLYLLDYKDEKLPKIDNQFDYTLEGLQKILAHLDKKQLKAIDNKIHCRKGFNELLEALTKNDHPFGLISIDGNWNIIGEKCEPIEKIEDYINSLDSPLDDEITPSQNNSWIRNIKSFYRKHDLKLGWLFSLIFSWIPYISIPILSIGFYKAFKKKISKKMKYTSYILYSLIFLLTIGYQQYLGYEHVKFHNNNLQKGYELVKDIKSGTFNVDPSGRKIGFMTIGEGKVSVDSIVDLIVLPDLKYREKFYFTIFLDFHNNGILPINNVGARIFHQRINNDLYLTGRLSGDFTNTISDVSEIHNVPKEYQIGFDDAIIRNTQGATNFERCAGSNYELPINIDIMHKMIMLPNLGIKENGWCDQGTVLVSLFIENISTDTIQN
ncbi:hypothetical protein IMCC3317_34350 [Kordia antarctica]|uniref:Uncharacterized protein n=1 Tax=Kordia antarctica TaxID=1218801 RepID=A0A7L4ZNH2_9FLAO|nr:hypothetical protein [Kordia antarctica]QHI38051.1 hypothetical protein IMCC3317_34350 [Kordia antarctica]